MLQDLGPSIQEVYLPVQTGPTGINRMKPYAIDDVCSTLTILINLILVWMNPLIKGTSL